MPIVAAALDAAQETAGGACACLISATAFCASVERDPDALAIVDGAVRLTYAQWYRRISAVVAGFDELGLMPGDHLVTLLQNRWEAATLHWACQFAGIVITPVNWRAKADEIDYLRREFRSEGGGVRRGVGGCRARIARSARRAAHCARCGAGRRNRVRDAAQARCARCRAARRRRRLVGDALHLGHDGQAEGRAAPPARRTRRRASPMSRRISIATANARSA